MKGTILIFSLVYFVNSVLGNTIECMSHYCECQPFLPRDLSLKKSIFFNKYPYPEHYAILGRAKELHCCIGGNFTRWWVFFRKKKEKCFSLIFWQILQNCPQNRPQIVSKLTLNCPQNCQTLLNLWSWGEILFYLTQFKT